MRHPRDILGVSIQAGPDEIRKNYLNLMKKYHPDKLQFHFPKGEALEMAKHTSAEILWAYELLKDPVKLRAFEESAHDLPRVINLSAAIEYLRYDDEGRPIGQVPRQSDRYRKLFESQTEEFRISVLERAVPRNLFQVLADVKKEERFIFDNSGQSFSTVYDFIRYKNSLAIKAEKDSNLTIPKIANDYAAILNVFKSFFQGTYYGQYLEDLKSDIQDLLSGELDISLRNLLLILSSIVNADQVDAVKHYEVLDQLYQIMYSAIDSAQSESSVQLMADRSFQHHIRTVQDCYLRLQKPKHLSKEWLSHFHSAKASYLLDKEARSQTYAQLEKDFSAAFKESDAPMSDEATVKQFEARMEQACKQIDISNVTFISSVSADSEDQSEESAQQSQHKKAKIDPIMSKRKQNKRMRIAHMGKANHYLLSAIAFQTSARSEREPARIAAGEYVALKLYRSAISEVRKASSITRLYIYYQVLSGVLAFQYQGEKGEKGETVDQFIKRVYSEFHLISQFMPFISMPISHNDVDKLTQVDEKWLYQVLNNISTNEAYSIEERTQASYLLFEGVYTGLFPEEHFDELRLRSIETYLQSKGMSIANMSEYLHPANSILKRSPMGFVNPTDELNISDVEGGRIISDIKGFTINVNSGELSFQLVYWQEGMPRSLRLMTELEFYDMLQYQLEKLNDSWFTLDPCDSLLPHLPLQEARSSLPNIPLRQTMLDADYAALKFFTTSAVSGIAPFDFQDTNEMLAHLPTHLIQVLMTKQNNAAGYFYNSTDPSRYWYKVGDVERRIVLENGAVVCQIGRAPLLMAHQKMVIDEHGKMVDDLAEDELGLMIVRALSSSHEIEKLITHVVDDTEKSSLTKLLEDFKEQESLLQEANQKLRTIKSIVEQDNTIPKKDKTKAIISRSTGIMQEIRDIKAVCFGIQGQLKQQLKQALDLNKVFARRFTEHMDELAFYIPIIGRLRLFVKLVAMKDAFLKIKADYSANALMMQQLDLLKINQVDPAQPESPQKVYVPAAIRRDTEGGLISFGGVSLRMSYTDKWALESAISRVALKEFDNAVGFNTISPSAWDINRANKSLRDLSSHMQIFDYIQAQQTISRMESSLRFNEYLNKTKVCFMDDFFQPDVVPTANAPLFESPNYCPPYAFPSVHTTPPVQVQLPGMQATIPTRVELPAGHTGKPPQPVTLPSFNVPSSPYACPGVQATDPVQIQFPAAQAPAMSVEPPPVNRSFLLPPNFGTDPYAIARVMNYQQDATVWHSELLPYCVSGQILSQPSIKEQDLLSNMQSQAHHLTPASHEIVSPVVNKFVNVARGLVKKVMDPISIMVMPQALSMFVATVVAMAHMPEAHASLVVPDCQAVKETVRQAPSLYDFAIEQLRKVPADTEILVPGMFPRTAEAFRVGFQSVTKDSKTLDDLGISPYPPQHHPKADPGAPDPMSIVPTLQCPADLQSLPEHLQGSLLYVINRDGGLSLHPYLLNADSFACSRDKETFYLNPKSKAIEAVLATGVVDLEKKDSELVIDGIHISEKYQNVPRIDSLIADAFERQGFGEVSGFLEHQRWLVSMPAGGPLVPPPAAFFASSPEEREQKRKEYVSYEIANTVLTNPAADLLNAFWTFEEHVRAAAKGVENTINVLSHPIDNILLPMTDLLYDATIIAARHMPASHPLTDGGDFILVQQLMIRNPKMYEDAVTRMSERVEHVKAIYPHFMQASGPERTEMLSESMTSIFAPGAFFKGTRVITKSVAAPGMNLYKFGIPFEPPKFSAPFSSAEKLRPIPKNLLMTTFSDVEKVVSQAGINNFLYVITESGELFISPEKLSQLGTKQRIFDHILAYEYIAHPELGQLQRVVAAGEVSMVKLENKVWLEHINNRSGHYKPSGEHLNTLVERVFNKHGFDARGKYRTYLPDPNIDQGLLAEIQRWQMQNK